MVGLYFDPPDRAVVLSVDETSQVQALDRTQTVLPMTLGQAERGTRDFVRHGTTSPFAALDVATGKVIGKCHRRHRHRRFVTFLADIDAADPAEDGVTTHLALDNYATHKTPAVKRWLAKPPRFVVHFTPTRGSWLNQVERFFAAITEKRIRREVFETVEALEQAIEAYLVEHNANPSPSRGPRPPASSSVRSRTFAHEPPTQDARQKCFTTRKIRLAARAAKGVRYDFAWEEFSRWDRNDADRRKHR
ncbi:hypothetical protein ETAA1_13670 [Urbifossiella limnaea]|uniref:Tc1-like transposase DDE domain-containing protein n=1 Tax=Urbifossiella limnaea TaxID=2528023 RepID=A0A517XPL0_9BACT|nr:hypothetical protein ETAA1_13670 [Urbifossiella limnaea]